MPKELGDLVNLTELHLDDNEFQGEFVCSSIHALYVLLTFSLFAGELPKELGQLTNLTYFNVSHNAQYEKYEDGDYDYDRPIPGTGFTGELYVPSYIHTLGHAHNGVLCVCTVTEEEKMALKAKLPGCL